MRILPATGKLFCPAPPVFFPEAQAVEHCADFSLNGVTVAGLHLSLYAMEALGNLLVLPHLRGQLRPCDARDLSCSRCIWCTCSKNRKALGKDRAAGKGKAVLRKVAALDAALLRDHAVIEATPCRQGFSAR